MSSFGVKIQNPFLYFGIIRVLVLCDEQEMHSNEAKKALPKLIVKGKASPFFQLISLKGQWSCFCFTQGQKRPLFIVALEVYPLLLYSLLD